MRRKKMDLLAALAALAVLLSGCMLKTVDQMYCLPRRSEEYYNLQSAMDQVMSGLDYCAPLQGENQQTVQMVDLTGDGQSEALVFAKGVGERPLKIFIFAKDHGVYINTATIETAGTAFEQVEYADLDGTGGVELVVGRQVSNEVVHALSAYTFSEGTPESILTANYTRFLTADLDQDGLRELFLLRPGTDGGNGVAELYDYHGGAMERSTEAAMSVPVENLKRVTAGGMYQNIQAVFAASNYNEDTIITDVYAMVKGRFTNISLSSESGTSIQTIRNYYVFGDDIDNDGLIELPALVPMEESSPGGRELIRWYNLTPVGEEMEKMFTFHNYADRWYVRIQEDWVETVSVTRGGDVDGIQGYVFSVGEGREHQVLFTIYAFTGDDREELAVADGRFLLAKTDEVVYAAALGSGSMGRQLDPKTLIADFHFIREDWKTGEM